MPTMTTAAWLGLCCFCPDTVMSLIRSCCAMGMSNLSASPVSVRPGRSHVNISSLLWSKMEHAIWCACMALSAGLTGHFSKLLQLCSWCGTAWDKLLQVSWRNKRSALRNVCCSQMTVHRVQVRVASYAGFNAQPLHHFHMHSACV